MERGRRAPQPASLATGLALQRSGDGMAGSGRRRSPGQALTLARVRGTAVRIHALMAWPSMADAVPMAADQGRRAARSADPPHTLSPQHSNDWWLPGHIRAPLQDAALCPRQLG